jgi:PDZ domain-containing protein
VVELNEEEPVPAPATAGEESPHWSRRRRWLTSLGFLFAVLIITLGLVLRLPYYVMSPGSSRPTESLISVSGAQTYVNGGEVDFLTVSLRQATPFEALAAWVNPDLDLASREDILGKQSPDQNRDLNLRLMTESKDAAQYQALTRLGYPVESTGTGAVVASVVESGPSANMLVPGDVIVRANGQQISFSQQLINVISATTPGATITLGVEPFDSTLEGALPPREVQVVLGAREGDTTKGFLGVSTFTRDLSFTFPVEVTIDSGRVGGPSAGLAFTLGILDVMTPESLTGGLNVSVTGTITLDGSVGPIGGIHQKVMASRRAGVDLMLVPASEIDEARKYAGDLRVEPVESLTQALEVLTTVGGGNLVLPAVGSTPAAN